MNKFIRLNKKTKKTFFCWLALAPLLLIIVFPLAVTLLTALKPQNELSLIPPDFFPSTFQWDNLIKVWQETNIVSALLNSIFISVSATLLAIAIAIPAAYAMSHYEFKGKSAYRFFLLITQMLSPIVLVLGLFRLMIYFGLVDSPLFLIIIYATFNLAFCTWMLQNYFETIPKELEESAWIEGAGHVRSLITIFLPLAIPSIVVIGMFTFVNSWNEFIIAFSTLRDADSYTIQLTVAEMTGYYSVRWDYVMVAIILASIPVAGFFFFLQKHLVGGLTTGAVK